MKKREAKSHSSSPIQSSGEAESTPNSSKTKRVSLPGIILGGCALSALLYALAFPPANCAWLSCLFLIPLLLLPRPKNFLSQLGIGYLFGYLAFALSLLWLNEVGFGAGFLLALWCAVFPALWYFLLGFLPRCPLCGAALWVATEYLRSTLLTGFPWNLLGVSLYRHPALIQSARHFGLYGLSFALCAINLLLALLVRCYLLPHPQNKIRHAEILLHSLLVLFVSAFIFLTPTLNHPASQSDSHISIAAIQPNLPQCRNYTQDSYQHTLDVLGNLTLYAVHTAKKQGKHLDLITWPECAIPVPFDLYSYALWRLQLMEQIKTPLLLGAITTYLPPGESNQEKSSVFNSAILLKADGQIQDTYHKMHRVPFGEFTPMGEFFPLLREWIGMGRDLTPGRKAVVFHLPAQSSTNPPQQTTIPCGVNICFEDVFPALSREFVKQGAQMLMTITNDSWYNRSAGAEQHMAQMVFRAVENNRPFLRVGNNSHTCLVTPNGKIQQLQDFISTIVFFDISIPATAPAVPWQCPLGPICLILSALYLLVRLWIATWHLS